MCSLGTVWRPIAMPNVESQASSFRLNTHLTPAKSSPGWVDRAVQAAAARRAQHPLGGKGAVSSGFARNVKKQARPRHPLRAPLAPGELAYWRRGSPLARSALSSRLEARRPRPGTLSARWREGC